MSKSKIDCQHIRNFSIIAHIDHGKSTLADRLMEKTGAVSQREMREQLLDDMDLERERGITIKARAVSMRYELEGQTYELNLIDTPGHVDFHYEVSRSLACCEGALLLVDAFQGVEAQTVANAFAAMESDLTIVPAINKVDLSHARPEQVKEEMEQSLGIDPDEVLPVQRQVGPGRRSSAGSARAAHSAPEGRSRGAAAGDGFRFALRRVPRRHHLRPHDERHGPQGPEDQVPQGRHRPRSDGAGAVRAAAAPLRRVAGRPGRLSDLQHQEARPTSTSATPSACRAKGRPRRCPAINRPSGWCSAGCIPPTDRTSTSCAKRSTKLAINDPSFEFEPETSDALGFGFRCGFLGLLHMEIIQQRLEQESDLDLVQTAPNVTYEIVTEAGETLRIYNPQKVPERATIEEFRQPIVRVNFVLPTDFIGAGHEAVQRPPGRYIRTEYLSPTRAMSTYNLPLAEVIYDLHDKLKSCTRGYGTMDYELVGYYPADLVRLDILVDGKRVDALSVICHRGDADRRGRAVVKKLRSEIDRHMFEVAIQAAIGTRVIARETISAMRKNVTAKCYGGDITRKRKLWAKQREGKKRMKSVGNVDIPQKAFMAVLETGGEK